MSEYRFSFPACMIAGKGRIETYDVLMLRKYAFPEGIRRSADAQSMLALHRLCPEQSEQWAEYFTESLANYLVNGGSMPGVIDERKAIWLIRAIADNGAVRSWLEIELMLHAMEIAGSISETLTAFALDQVRIALASGQDPSQRDRNAYARKRPAHIGITVFDLHYIWRVLRPAVARGRVVLSPIEMTVLREIDDVAAKADHHPGWTDIMRQLEVVLVPRDLSPEPAGPDRGPRVDDDSMQEDCAA